MAPYARVYARDWVDAYNEIIIGAGGRAGKVIMNKEELTEYRNYVLSRYDEWLYTTEKRGASYGECAYFESLTEKELDEMCAELDAEFEKLEKKGA